jgi:hypothetical protein
MYNVLLPSTSYDYQTVLSDMLCSRGAVAANMDRYYNIEHLKQGNINKPNKQ